MTPEQLDALFAMRDRIKANTFYACFEFLLSKAQFTARLYATPTEQLPEVKKEVDAQRKHRGLLERISECLGTSLWNIPRDVVDEMKYRTTNARSPDEWRQPFTQLAESYQKAGHAEVADYILHEAMPAYQQHLFGATPA